MQEEINSIMREIQKRAGLVSEDKVSLEKIEARYRLLTEKFQVPSEDARKSVINFFLKELGVSSNPKEISQVKINELLKKTNDDFVRRWVAFDAKAIKIFETENQLIEQAGILADETGIVRFVKWIDTPQSKLVENENYHFDGVVVDEYQGKINVVINRSTKITPCDRNIQAVKYEETAKDTVIADINEEGQWININARVIQVWDDPNRPFNESIQQQGLISDSTGVIRFVTWSQSDQPELEPGESYRFENVVTSEYNGKYSICINRYSKITKLNEPVESKEQYTKMIGAIVDVQENSGLIKRCTLCKRVLSKGVCPIHGKVSSDFDLRAKAVIDDGEIAQDIIIQRELLEDLVGLTLEDAKKIMADTMNYESIYDMIFKALFGRYFEVEGPLLNQYIVVKNIKEIVYDENEVIEMMKELTGGV